MITSRAIAFASIILVPVFLACREPPTRATRAGELSLTLAYSGVRRALHDGRHACGNTSVNAARLVFLTARQCLSCRDLGHMLRELQKRSPRGEQFAIGVPASDTALVCGFVREERITAPVIGIPAKVPDDGLSNSALIAYARLSAGVIADSAVAQDGLTLLSMLQARGDIGP